MRGTPKGSQVFHGSLEFAQPSFFSVLFMLKSFCPSGVIAGTSPLSASRGPAQTPITSCLGAGPPVPRLLLNIANLLAGILWLGSFCRRCASWATAAEEKTRTPTINRKHGTGLIFIGYSLFFGWGHKLVVNLL